MHIYKYIFLHHPQASPKAFKQTSPFSKHPQRSIGELQANVKEAKALWMNAFASLTEIDALETKRIRCNSLNTPCQNSLFNITCAPTKKQRMQAMKSPAMRTGLRKEPVIRILASSDVPHLDVFLLNQLDSLGNTLLDADDLVEGLPVNAVPGTLRHDGLQNILEAFLGTLVLRIRSDTIVRPLHCNP